MNNLKKIGLTALGTALVATTGHAADFSVSGSTAITYVSQSGNVKSKWSQGDSITFTTSGEMDNGMSVTYKYEIDDGATGAKMVTVSNDLGSLQLLVWTTLDQYLHADIGPELSIPAIVKILNH